MTMIQSYVKIALRNLVKHRAYSFINIFGLAVGLACCILILLFVQDELSYDRHYANADRIYRLTEFFDMGIREERYPSIPFPVAPAMRAAFPEVESIVRFWKTYKHKPLIRFGEKEFYEDRFFFADSTVFEVFSHQFVRGDPRTALRTPRSVVLTETMARKYFGESDPIGKVLTFDERLQFQIDGVIKDLPSGTHFHYDFIASLLAMEEVFTLTGIPTGWMRSWYWNPCYTYFLLPENVSADNLESRFPGFIETHFPENLRGSGIAFGLQPLTDIHLYSNLDEEPEPVSDVGYVYVFSVVALFVLLIACVNFMNLATARSALRAKEVGLRKVLGAYRTQLVRQFLGESLLLSALAALVAMVVVELALPIFNSLTGKELSTDYFASPTLAGLLLLITLVVGLLAGSYPAFVLSRFNPVDAWKGAGRRGPAGVSLRKLLVVSQFTVSIILIIGTVVVLQQMGYIREKKLGFERDQIIFFSLRGTTLKQEHQAFKQALLSNPDILGAAAVSDVPSRPVQVYPFRVEGIDERLDLPALFIDPDFLPSMGIDLAEGRNFAPYSSVDSLDAWIVNEAAVRKFGWTEPLGKGFQFGDGRRGQIVGIVKDFHFASLRQPVNPLVIKMNPFWYEFMVVRVRQGAISPTISFLEETWARFVPERPLVHFFLDEDLDMLYRAEDRLGKVFSSFALLAIVIACLGLFGLAAFTSEQRTKEIGIRKVLGATEQGIVLLFSRDFIKLVLVANLIAWPIAYFVMSRWLEDFAYRIDLSWTVFLAAGAGALLITVVTVSYQAIKAALANPVEALKYE